MTPKENAEELMGSFIQIMPILDKQTGKDIMEHAKNCALITVDEIIKASPYLPTQGSMKDYWRKVKSELNNL